MDILVNNALVNFNFGPDNSLEYAEKVFATNYYGTKNMIKAMIPLLRPLSSSAHIVNVSSRLGRLNGMRNRIGNIDLRRKLEDNESLSEELIDQTMDTFLEGVKDGASSLHGLFSVKISSQCLHEADVSDILGATRREKDMHQLLLSRVGEDRYD